VHAITTTQIFLSSPCRFLHGGEMHVVIEFCCRRFFDGQRRCIFLAEGSGLVGAASCQLFFLFPQAIQDVDNRLKVLLQIKIGNLPFCNSLQ